VNGILYLVGTPIGNLGDVTPRSREVLHGVELVAAEDTRRTGRLLQTLGLHKRMVSLHDANERERTEELIAALREGWSIAVVSDAGMPLISDPGYHLVRTCVAEGVEIRVVPGPSAAIAALIVSGLPTDRFAFEGFPPRKPGERIRRLELLRDDPRTTVFYESPTRVRALLGDLLAAWGDRRVAVCREMTKLHEEVVRGRLSEVLGAIADELKGEVVVVVEGAAEPPSADFERSVIEARELVSEGMRKRDAAHAVAERRGLGANDLYRALLGDPSQRGY
jgi:16S rRNA (cytidine1402-2'-O)-methyltransferase